MMACHTVHYDTTVLGRLVPFVSVTIVMLPGPRRSARDKAAKERAMKESTEDTRPSTRLEISTPKTQLKTAMAQDQTGAARMVAQGCTKIPTK